jgi:N-acetylglucosaminyl-diphospho-decaprenol L-rhamnosyltransferase
MSAPRVAVVVVTYNSADVLPQCLESLRDGGADGVELTDVVVVDNASHDTSTEIAKETDGLPISVVQLTENAGYAAGLNAGITALRNRPPDAVMVVNPDCRFRAKALATLAGALRVPGRGIVAPRLVNLDGTLQPTMRRLPTVLGAVAEAVLGGRIADRLGLGELIFTDAPHDDAGPAAWVTGAALLMAWALLETVGPWDETFLLYSEETEFMLRAADHGWSTWYEPTAVIEHKGGESGTRPSLAALLTVNKVKLFQRRHGWLEGRAYTAGILLGALFRAAAGQRTARASVAALLFPSRRITSLAQLR